MASCAIGANYKQTVEAFKEAENYEGPAPGQRETESPGPPKPPGKGRGKVGWGGGFGGGRRWPLFFWGEPVFWIRAP